MLVHHGSPDRHERQRPPSVALGQVVATPGALRAFAASGEGVAPYLRRHASGDWGDLEPEDREANNAALVSGERLLSAYWLQNRTRIWIITEADRSVTTVLLPEEY
jgi:hypothetical protein